MLQFWLLFNRIDGDHKQAVRDLTYASGAWFQVVAQCFIWLAASPLMVLCFIPAGLILRNFNASSAFLPEFFDYFLGLSSAAATLVTLLCLANLAVLALVSGLLVAFVLPRNKVRENELTDCSKDLSKLNLATKTMVSLSFVGRVIGLLPASSSWGR